MSESHGGYIRAAGKAAELSQRMRLGDSDDALRLLQCRRAPAGIEKRAWASKVYAMNAARRQKYEQEWFHAQAVVAERERQEVQSTFRCSPSALVRQYGAIEEEMILSSS